MDWIIRDFIDICHLLEYGKIKFLCQSYKCGGIMYKIIIKDKFDSAHFLPDYEGKCRMLHGHTWYVEITFLADNSDLHTWGSETGMIVDFAKLREMVKNILPDHQSLNTIEKVPTAENLARYVFNKIKQVNPYHLDISSVALWESPNCGVEYMEDN